MKNNTEKLSGFEYNLLWMAIRYAMNRSSAICSTLPMDIMENYYHRLTKELMADIVDDLKNNSREFGENAFGHKAIDRPIWLKFMCALDVDSHYIVTLTDGTNRVVFDFDGKIIPLQKYIDEPHIGYSISPECIVDRII